MKGISPELQAAVRVTKPIHCLIHDIKVKYCKIENCRYYARCHGHGMVKS